MNCFRCGYSLPDNNLYLCDSCQKSIMDDVRLRQPKRYQGLAEKELKRNARELRK